MQFFRNLFCSEMLLNVLLWTIYDPGRAFQKSIPVPGLYL
jgi:hypothetical protein